MTLPNLSLDSTAESMLAEHVHCRTTMAADPFAAAHAPAFDALITDGIEVTTLRLQLVIAIAQARANGFQLDLQLNKFVDRLVLALQKITDLHLPSDYAEHFFLHDTSRRGAGKPRSAEEIEREMGANPSLHPNTD